MKAKVGVIMGSASDARVMKAACEVLRDFGVAFESKVVSAHRTPKLMQEYALHAADRGLKILIAGAGGAAHLPGMVASLTPLPVIGVPVAVNAIKGLDSLLSIAQMPKGVPVAAVSIDNAHNAALLAIRILALEDKKLQRKLDRHRRGMKAKVAKSQGGLKRLLR